MRIDDKFLDKLAMERNLLSCIKNMLRLAESVQEIQDCIDEIQLKVGIPRKFTDPPEK
jgi:hypothetical protein